MNLIDLLILIVIILSYFSGYKTGLIVVFTFLFAFFLSLYLTPHLMNIAEAFFSKALLFNGKCLISISFIFTLLMLNALVGKFLLLVADILGISRISKNSFIAGFLNVLLSILMLSLIIKSLDWANMYMLFSNQWKNSLTTHYLLEINSNFFKHLPFNFFLPWKN
ncbi:membrane protein required for colicin V production [Thermodesulfobium acidiphilum]|uniref:Membrane protein required for colicin V production n=1 Tax=Thermodesulfobium acidiphilum TaxID=1794699 RepID=A0A2R4VZZ0_THEAF|nr:hypothetical protein [Thermodesulfobium acidiphilum]AWB10034.1 membrane protein required for colicin V production [Thermodesulfobium acidiphilum]PMP85722.1 MAG: hypothetical protein C0174_03530 [Thermodesulfobium narugense]